MPYIKEQDRDALNPYREHKRAFGDFIGVPLTPGELNYVLTEVVLRYLRNKTTKEEYPYGLLNEAIGALECCKQELYRRIVAKVEDEKCAENGDVF